MSRPFPIKMESNSTESDIYLNKNTNQKINRTKFSSKKSERGKKEKIFEIKKDCQKNFEKINDDFFQNENMNSFLNEVDLYIKEINPENHEFAKSEINSEETFKLKLNYSFQERSEDSYSLSVSPMMDKNPMSSINGISNIIFSNNPMNESDSISSFKSFNVSEQIKAKIFIIEKVRRKKKARKYNADNIRKKIMRSLYRYLRNKLNTILKQSGCKNYFDFFPNQFISDITKKNIKKILNMTLYEIFLDENLYNFEKKDVQEKYVHNSRVVNMRIKIKRSFFRALRKKLNAILKKSGCKNYLDFFPNKYVSDINKERNNHFLNKSLKYVFANKDSLSKYEHNKNVVKSEEIKNNEKLQNILNKTFSQIYDDFINSDEFNVNEINRLKRSKKHDDNYIDRYEIIAKNLISFFSQ